MTNRDDELTTILLTALEELFALHEPDGRFQPSYFKPVLMKAKEAIQIAKLRSTSSAEALDIELAVALLERPGNVVLMSSAKGRMIADLLRSQDARNAELERELAEARDDRREAVEDKIDTAVRLAEAVEALKPFVAHYEPWMDEHTGTMSSAARVTFEQVRRARSIVEDKANG